MGFIICNQGGGNWFSGTVMAWLGAKGQNTATGGTSTIPGPPGVCSVTRTIGSHCILFASCRLSYDI